MLAFFCGACDGGPPRALDGSQLADSGLLDGGTPDGSSSVDGAAGALEIDAYMDQFFDRICGWFIECEPKLGLVALGETVCHPRRAEETRAEFVALVARGGVAFDPELAARCLEEISAAECNVASLDLARCDEAFVPRAAVGEACVRDLECVDGRCVTGDSCPGRCVARAAAGGSCTRPSDCISGLGCVGGLCATRRAAGEACERRTDCGFPLTCTLNGTCGTPPIEGEACSSGLGGDLCAGDWVCASAAGGAANTCAVGGAPGDACGGDLPCAPGGRCVEGRCVATAPPGGTCAPGGCIALHVCTEGRCRPLPVHGQACSTSLPCAEGECVGGTCARLAPGESCDPADEPQFGSCVGRCVSGTCATPRIEGARCTRSGDCEEGLECREGSGAPVCRPVCG